MQQLSLFARERKGLHQLEACRLTLRFAQGLVAVDLLPCQDGVVYGLAVRAHIHKLFVEPCLCRAQPLAAGRVEVSGLAQRVPAEHRGLYHIPKVVAHGILQPFVLAAALIVTALQKRLDALVGLLRLSASWQRVACETH